MRDDDIKTDALDADGANAQESAPHEAHAKPDAEALDGREPDDASEADESAPAKRRGLKLEIGSDPEYKNAKERLYDKIPLTVKQMDVIIAILVALFAVLLVIGYLRGSGIS